MSRPKENEKVLALEPEVIKALYEWHGGQFTAVYSLASYGQGHLVSLEMIEDALSELRRDRGAARRSIKEARSAQQAKQYRGMYRHIEKLISELELVQAYPEEFEVRDNPHGKRVTSRVREGTLVVFDPTPASLMLHSRPPRIGERGKVTKVNTGRRKSTYIRGPGGGMVYVHWETSGTQGVSPMDLRYGR